MRHQQIGDAQAWYYRPDHTLVFWELNVYDRYRSAPTQAEDPFFAALWHDIEAYLLTQLPDVKQLATPSWEPEVEPEQWQNFLTSLGYHSKTPRAFVKSVGGPLPSSTST